MLIESMTMMRHGIVHTIGRYRFGFICPMYLLGDMYYRGLVEGWIMKKRLRYLKNQERLVI